MKLKIRVIGVLLVLIMLLSMMPATASAATVVASGYCGGEGNGRNLIWTLTDGGTLIISGNGSMADYKSYFDSEEGWLVDAPWHSYRSSIKCVTIAKNVTSIGNKAFYMCRSITDLDIGCSVTSIGDSAFRECESLAKVTVPGNVKEIGAYAFTHCNGLTEIALSEGLVSIGDNAISYCDSLRSVTIPASVTFIGDHAFQNNNAMKEIIVDPSNENYIDEDGVLCNKNKTTLICYPDGKPAETYRVPDGITAISGAFFFPEKLRNIIFNTTVETVGRDEFAYCYHLDNAYFQGNAPWWLLRASGNSLPEYGFDDAYTCFDEDTVLYYIPGTSGWTDSDAYDAEAGTWKGYKLAVWDENCPHSWIGTGEACSGPKVCVLCGATDDVPLGHIESNTVNENVIPVTCGTDGSYDSVVYCAICDAELSRMTITVPATEKHIEREAVTENDTDASYDSVVYCAVCDVELSRNTVNKTKVIASGYCGGEGYGTNLTWTLTAGGTLTISGTGAMKDYTNSEAPWYTKRMSIRELVIGESVTTVGDSAFAEIDNLTDVVIPDSVVTIGSYAFRDSGIKSIDVGDGVTGIKTGAFYNCGEMNSITLGKKLSTINCIFDGCSSLASITIPESVTEIAVGALQCDAFSEINVEEGNEYFSDQDGVLFNKSKTELIFFPIRHEVKDYRVPDGVITISESAFCCTDVRSVIISDSVTTIGDFAFKDCELLENVVIGNGVTSICGYSFYCCPALTEVIIPDSVTEIGVEAFAGTNLTSVYFEGNAPSVYDNDELEYDFRAFPMTATLYYIPGMTGWTDSDAYDAETGTWNGHKLAVWGEESYVAKIGDVYYGTLAEAVEAVAENGTIELLADTDEAIAVSKALTINRNGFEAIGLVATWGYKFSVTNKAYISIRILPASGYCGGEGDGTNLSWNLSVAGVLTITGTGKMADYQEKGAPWYQFRDFVKTVVIGNGVTTIGEYAFENCMYLSEVTIGTGVTIIGDFAFKGCTSIKDIVIPGNVDTIKGNAFSDCSGLTSVTLPPNLNTIKDKVFSGCNNLTNIKIPEGVKDIVDNTFADCSSLTEITIPDSVTFIGAGAFASCGSLTAVYFEGNAPVVTPAEELGHTFDAETVVLYYIPGMTGWTDSEAYDAEAGTWNGYKLAVWKEMCVHNWIAADCDTPKTCSVCGKTEGKALGHTASEAVKENETETSYESVVYCSVCGTELRRELIIIGTPDNPVVEVPITVIMKVHAANDKRVDLTINCGTAGVTFDSKALEEIINNALDAAEVQLSIEKNNDKKPQNNGAEVFEINLTAKGQTGGIWSGDNNEGIATVKIHVGKNKNSVKVYYVDENGNSQTMDDARIEDGYVVFTAKHFSTYEIVTTEGVASVNGTAYGTLAEAVEAAAAGDTIELLSDTDEIITVSKALVIKRGGFTASGLTAAGDLKLTVSADTYSISGLPNAKVENLGHIQVDVGSYYIYDLIGNSGMSNGTAPFDLQVAMKFEAKDSLEEAKANAYGNYTTDFFITINGIEGGSFVADDCYLAGYYPSFNAWVKIPLDNFTIENGKIYPVITSAGFDFKYTDIVNSVGEFTCGIYLSEEVLAASPNLTVDLALGLSEDMEAAQSAQFTGVDNYVYDVEDLKGYPTAVEKSSMVLGNDLSIMFAFTADDITGTDNYATITKSYADGAADRMERIEQSAWGDSIVIGGKNYYAISFDGVAAKEMTDEVQVQIFNAAGEPISEVYTDTIRDYAMRMIEQDIDTTMFVDMLVYGAEAQKQFDNYAIDDLATSQLTAQQLAQATQSVSYENNLVADNGYRASSLILESNIQLAVLFGGIDQTMTAEVSFTDHYGETKSYTIAGSEFEPVTYKGEACFSVTVDELVVADGRQPVTVTVKDVDGNVMASVTDSMESYIARMSSTGTLYEAIMKFSDSAAAGLKN